MRFKAAVVMFLLATFALAQNAAVQWNPAAKSPQVIQVGNNFVVRVTSMPGAGYSWEVWKTGREGLSLISQSSSPKTKGVIGGPQTVTYVFRATEAGSPVITMVYGRPWELEKGAAPTKTLTIPVIIK